MTDHSPDRMPILLYHSLTAEAGRAYRPYTVAPDVFRAQMESIAEAGLASTTISDLLGRGLKDGRAIAITFDDGFREIVDVALPILTACGLTASVYIVTGHIGGTSRWLDRDGEGNRPLLSWAEIRSLAAAGIEIGAHGHRHLPLDLLSETEAAAEISRSRLALEDGLGRPVTSFAYPYGFHTRAVKRLVAGEGFRGACGVRHAFSHAEDDPYALARIMVYPRTPMNTFRSWIQGRGQLPTSWREERMRTRVWRVARRLRSKVGR
jgi:peptidoglycan/xylan/chitin deacetylase (PgdA/CDA1 family)